MSWWSVRASRESAPRTTCRPTAPTGRTRSSRVDADIGGTWDLFRYPGVRSDSDMHTLGYSFKPWTDVEGDRRRAVDPFVPPRDGRRVRHRSPHPLRPPRDLGRVVDATTPGGPLTVDAGRHRRHRPTHVRLPVHVLRLLQLQGRLHAGVPRHRRLRGPGRAPPGVAGGSRLRGQEGRRHRIGRHRRSRSSRRWPTPTEHITMLQRSPTYVVSRPDQDAIANNLRKVLPDGIAYDVTRSKNATLQQVIYKRTRTRPEKSKDVAPQAGAQGAGRRLRRRHALHAHVLPVGPTAVPRAEQRSVRGDPVGQGVGRHRHDRHVHRDRASSSRPAPSSTPTSS